MEEKQMNNQNNQYPLGGYNQNQYNQQGMPVGNQMYNMNQPQGHSGLAIASFVLALLGCTSLIGLILGIVDVAVNKQRKHGLSIAAIVISSIWLVLSVGVYSGNNVSSKKVDLKTTVGSSQSTEVDGNNVTDDSATDEIKTTQNKKTIYHIGDVIDVKSDNGEYKLCITNITETNDRNQFSDTQADRVVIIDYEYENIDYNVEFGDYKNNELSISSWDFSMYDADGNILDTYPADRKYAKSVSPGHKSSGQMAYALNNSSNYIEAEYHDNFLTSSDFTIELQW